MWLTLTDKFRETLEQAGVADLFKLRRGTVVRRDSKTLTQRMVLDDEQRSAVYLKQYRHGPSYLVRKSRARREWENIRRLHELGLPVPEPLAAGERRRSVGRSEAFIVTAEIPDCQTLETVLPELVGRERRELLTPLAELVARMHRTGFVHHDLHWRNVLVRSDRTELYIIDCPRGCWPRGNASRRRGQRRDLACLDRSARNLFSRTDRLRFYLSYVGRTRLSREDRSAITQIDRMVRRAERKHRRARERRQRNVTLERNDSFVSTLKNAGLTTLRDFLDDTRAEIFDRHGRRSVARLTLRDEHGGGVFYLKRFGPRHLKDDLKSLLRLRRPMSLAEAEWLALGEFHAAGLPVPEPVAWGQRRRFFRSVQSFLLVAEVPGRPLSELVRDKTLSSQRKSNLSAALADLIRRMHEADLSDPDLYAKHVLVEERDDGWNLHLVDLQRAGRGKGTIRDLAALNASLPPPHVSAADRLRFFLAYRRHPRLTAEDRNLIARIMRQTRRVVKRRHVTGWNNTRER